jgi:hypothetical protein
MYSHTHLRSAIQVEPADAAPVLAGLAWDARRWRTEQDATEAPRLLKPSQRLAEPGELSEAV